MCKITYKLFKNLGFLSVSFFSTVLRFKRCKLTGISTDRLRQCYAIEFRGGIKDLILFHDY